MTARIRPSLPGFVRLAIGLTLVSTVSAAEADRWQLIVRIARPGAGDLPILVEVSPSLPVGDYVLEIPGTPGPISAQVFGETGKRWLGSVFPSVPVQGAYGCGLVLPRIRRSRKGSGSIPGARTSRSSLTAAWFQNTAPTSERSPFSFPWLARPAARTRGLTRWRRWPARTMITPINGRSGLPMARSTGSISGPSKSVTERSRKQRGSPSCRVLCWVGCARATTGLAPMGERSVKTSASLPFTRQGTHA